MAGRKPLEEWARHRRKRVAVAGGGRRRGGRRERGRWDCGAVGSFGRGR